MNSLQNVQERLNSVSHFDDLKTSIANALASINNCNVNDVLHNPTLIDINDVLIHDSYQRHANHKNLINILNNFKFDSLCRAIDVIEYNKKYIAVDGQHRLIIWAILSSKFGNKIPANIRKFNFNKTLEEQCSDLFIDINTSEKAGAAAIFKILSKTPNSKHEKIKNIFDKRNIAVVEPSENKNLKKFIIDKGFNRIYEAYRHDQMAFDEAIGVIDDLWDHKAKNYTMLSADFIKQLTFLISACIGKSYNNNNYSSYIKNFLRHYAVGNAPSKTYANLLQTAEGLMVIKNDRNNWLIEMFKRHAENQNWPRLNFKTNI